MARLQLVLLASLAAFSCVCSRKGGGGDSGKGPAPTATSLAAGFVLDRPTATSDLAQIAMAPHPFGSPRQADVAAFITARATGAGLTVVAQPISATVPNPAALNATGPVAETLTKQGVNVWARVGEGGLGSCVVLFASHYDSKIVPNVDYVGANDGGSSSIALLQLLTYLKAQATDTKAVCDFMGVWFDGEEAVLFGWNDGERLHPAKIEDHLYGSRFAADALTDCEFEGSAAVCLPASLGGMPLVALILMDMIGAKDVALTRDTLSHAGLQSLVEEGADALGLPAPFSGSPKPISDDHEPFVKRGVTCVDLIDFNHLEVWHKAGDDAAQVSQDSVEMIGKIALYVGLRVAQEPKVFSAIADP